MSDKPILNFINNEFVASASVGAPADAVRVIVQEIPKTQWGIGGKAAHELGRRRHTPETEERT